MRMFEYNSTWLHNGLFWQKLFSSYLVLRKSFFRQLFTQNSDWTLRRNVEYDYFGLFDFTYWNFSSNLEVVQDGARLPKQFVTSISVII